MKSVLFLFFPAGAHGAAKTAAEKRRSGGRSERKSRVGRGDVERAISSGGNYSILTVAEPVLFQKHKSELRRRQASCAKKSREPANPIADSPLYKVQDPASRVPKRPANGGPPSSLIPLLSGKVHQHAQHGFVCAGLFQSFLIPIHGVYGGNQLFKLVVHTSGVDDFGSRLHA